MPDLEDLKETAAAAAASGPAARRKNSASKGQENPAHGSDEDDCGDTTGLRSLRKETEPPSQCERQKA